MPGFQVSSRWLSRGGFLLLVVASVAAILYLTEQREGAAAQARVLALLDKLEAQLNDLHADIVSARLGELLDYDDIATDTRIIGQLTARLQQTLAGNAAPAADAALERLRETLDQTRTQAADAVRFIASRRSSLHYLPLLLDSLNRHGPAGASRLILAYRYQAALLSQAMNATGRGADQDVLPGLRARLLDEADRAGADTAVLLNALLEHGRLVAYYSMRIRTVMDGMMVREPVQFITELRNLVRADLARRQGLSVWTTRVLYLLLLLVAVVIVRTWIRAQATARHLQHSNRSLAQQMRERQQVGRLLEIQRDTLEKVASGEDSVPILDGLCRAFERLLPGSVCLLTHAPDAHIRFLAAPTLEPGLREHFDGLALLPGNGSCSVTMLDEEPLFINDVHEDPRWSDVRGLARRFDIHACWSHPVYISPDDVGSFTMLRFKRGIPAGFQRYAMETGARLAGIVIRRAQDNERIQFMASRDSLTALPNRALFRDRLEQALERAKRHGGIGGVLFVDLDHFKDVNDSKGHSAGDRLLVQVARRLRDCLRSVDTVARLGGDEFVVLIEDLGSGRDAAESYLYRVAEKIRHAIAEPFEIDSGTVSLSSSIGIILFPLDADNAEHVLQHADAAMYVAKSQGRNGFHFFHPAMVEELNRRLAIESSVARAVEHDEFEIFYQPKVDGDRVLLGAEALLRWRDPQQGILMPDAFLPVLYRLGLIRDVEFRVIEKVGADLRRWLDTGLWPQGARLSINISPGQFRSHSFARRVAALLRDGGVSPCCFELELTEQLFVEDAETAARIMTELKTLGLRLAIDDFGTGYSSLMYLKKMPLDTLKIDQGFIRDLPGDEEDAVIVDTIIGMADFLDLRVVAEGVENDEQFAYLCRRHVPEFQGFLFSRPLSVADFERHWLEPGEA